MNTTRKQNDVTRKQNKETERRIKIRTLEGHKIPSIESRIEKSKDRQKALLLMTRDEKDPDDIFFNAIRQSTTEIVALYSQLSELKHELSKTRITHLQFGGNINGRPNNKVVGFSTNQAVHNEKINYARESIRMLQDVKAAYESELNLLMQGDYVKGSIINDGRVKELNLLIMGVDKQIDKITPKYKQLVTGSSPLTDAFNKVRDSIKNKSAKPAAKPDAKPDANEKPKDPAINQEDGPQPGEA